MKYMKQYYSKLFVFRLVTRNYNCLLKVNISYVKLYSHVQIIIKFE